MERGGAGTVRMGTKVNCGRDREGGGWEVGALHLPAVLCCVRCYLGASLRKVPSFSRCSRVPGWAGHSLPPSFLLQCLPDRTVRHSLPCLALPYLALPYLSSALPVVSSTLHSVVHSWCTDRVIRTQPDIVNPNYSNMHSLSHSHSLPSHPIPSQLLFPHLPTPSHSLTLSPFAPLLTPRLIHLQVVDFVGGFENPLAIPAQPSPAHQGFPVFRKDDPLF